MSEEPLVFTNVYAALGFPCPEEMQEKSRLVIAISNLMEMRQFNDSQAARIVSEDIEVFADMRRGHFRNISTEHIQHMLDQLRAI